MFPRSLLLAAALVCLSAPLVRADVPAAEFRDGRWRPIEAPTTQPVSDPQLDRIQLLLRSQDNTVALKLGLLWIKNHDNKAPLRDQTVFLLGQTFFQLDERIKAFYYFDEVMDEYPSSPLFYPALEMQYKIADDFLNGHKTRFLGLPLFTAEEEGIEMLFRIQQRSPGSPLAEKALLRTADYYYSEADYDLAHDVYTVYKNDYPRSPMIPTVLLRRAFSSLAQFRGVRFDSTQLIDGRAELVEIETAYPDLAAEENLQSLVMQVDDTLAQKVFSTADFYRRTRQPRGAVFEYRLLIDRYPNSPLVPTAQAALTKMPQWTLDEPGPPPSKEER